MLRLPTECNRKYTSNWDSLINFVENGEIFIIQRREETVLLDYGAEETTLYLDTLGSISVVDSIFSNLISFNPQKMKYVPGYDNVEFEMWAGQIGERRCFSKCS